MKLRYVPTRYGVWAYECDNCGLMMLDAGTRLLHPEWERKETLLSWLGITEPKVTHIKVKCQYAGLCCVWPNPLMVEVKTLNDI